MNSNALSIFCSGSDKQKELLESFIEKGKKKAEDLVELFAGINDLEEEIEIKKIYSYGMNELRTEEDIKRYVEKCFDSVLVTGRYPEELLKIILLNDGEKNVLSLLNILVLEGRIEYESSIHYPILVDI